MIEFTEGTDGCYLAGDRRTFDDGIAEAYVEYRRCAKYVGGPLQERKDDKVMRPSGGKTAVRTKAAAPPA